MEERLPYGKLSAEPAKAMFGLGAYLARCGLEKDLLELIKIRASQINGCAYCIDMHTTDARTIGETEGNLIMTTARRCGRRPSAAARPQGGVLAHTGLAARRASAHPAQARRPR